LERSESRLQAASFFSFRNVRSPAFRRPLSSLSGTFEVPPSGGLFLLFPERSESRLQAASFNSLSLSSAPSRHRQEVT
jgi:hypothetical protein